MKFSAAVLVEQKHPLELDELEVPILQKGQVLVKMMYSGVCHTQLLEIDGYRGADRYIPHCLGHEGCGEVLEIGPSVTKVSEGAEVVLTWMKGLGLDVCGPVYKGAGCRLVNAGAVTTFNELAVVSENRLVSMPNDFPKQYASLLGCAVPTGFGSVINVANVSAGKSLAVVGCGGVGLSAIIGAAISGCSPIVAIDLQAKKLSLAKDLGATHCVNASADDPVLASRTICPSGFDYVIDCCGCSGAVENALEMVKERMGKVVVVGNSRLGEFVHLDIRHLNLGKRLLGSWGGNNVPDVDFPRYATMLKPREQLLARLADRTYSLIQINEALSDLSVGRTVRPIIAF